MLASSRLCRRIPTRRDVLLAFLSFIFFSHSLANSQVKVVQKVRESQGPEDALTKLSPDFSNVRSNLARPCKALPDARLSIDEIMACHPGRNQAMNGFPGDPVNLIFIGSDDRIPAVLTSLGWTRVSTDLRVAWADSFEDIFLRGTTTKHFPMTDWMINGKKQDVNWAKAQSVSTRHHFRLYKTNFLDKEGTAVWWGTANFDNGITRERDKRGRIFLKHTTDPNVDRERDYLREEFRAALDPGATFLIASPRIPASGKNALGNPFVTDRRTLVVIFR